MCAGEHKPPCLPHLQPLLSCRWTHCPPTGSPHLMTPETPSAGGHEEKCGPQTKTSLRSGQGSCPGWTQTDLCGEVNWEWD